MLCIVIITWCLGALEYLKEIFPVMNSSLVSEQLNGADRKFFFFFYQPSHHEEASQTDQQKSNMYCCFCFCQLNWALLQLLSVTLCLALRLCRLQPVRQTPRMCVCVCDTGHRVSTMERDEFHMDGSPPLSFLTPSIHFLPFPLVSLSTALSISRSAWLSFSPPLPLSVCYCLSGVIGPNTGRNAPLHLAQGVTKRPVEKFGGEDFHLKSELQRLEGKR